MTLIDKAEALAILAPAPNAKDGLWAKRKQALYDAIAALPARGVGPEDVPFLLRFADGEPHGTGMHDMTGPEDRLYLAGYLETVNHRGRRLTDKGRALVAALAPTDAAQAREAALREAAEIAMRHLSKVQINETLWHEGQDWAAQRIADAILALIGEHP